MIKVLQGDQMIDARITWHDISAEVADHPLPDAVAEVMIYDQVLDDVVLGHLDDNGFGVCAWIDDSTGQPLPAPLYWAKKPFPSGV